MKRTSLAEAKAHLSALVDEAEHRGTKTMILRHGRPSAVIVPVDAVTSPKLRSGKRTRGLSAKQVRRLLGQLGGGRRRHSAVADLLGGRR